MVRIEAARMKTYYRIMLGTQSGYTTKSFAGSRTLSALRDTLLPKLMRGDVRVRETVRANG